MVFKSEGWLCSSGRVVHHSPELRLRRTGICILFLAVPLVYKMALSNESNNKVQAPKPKIKEETTLLYGEFLSWDKVDKLFPKYAKATVIDFETGLKFHVQRRAGSSHADVQPLTAEDTAVMNEIYNGKWSWKRRAILVELDNGRKIAASMHGMPHGAGAIRGNNFNGHFCIHFRNSTTHGSGEINIDHQIMVWKAANRINEQLQSLSPRVTIESFFAAVNQGEINVAEKLIDDDSKYETQLLVGLQDIESVRIYNLDTKEKNSFRITAGVVYKDSYKEYIKNLSISLRHKKNQPRQINPQTILPLLDKDVWLEIKQWNINQMAEEI